MKKSRYLIIALLCAVAQGAWAADYNVGTESELRDAISNGANIKLTADIALSNCLEIGDGGSSTPTVTIDLNGKTLSRSLEAADADGHVIWVRTGSTLTVTDGSGNNSGQITGGWASNGGGICNYGTLYFQSGTITGCQTDYTGGAIRNNGTATISGGVITNCSAPYGGALYNTGTLTISGGTISNSSSTTGGGGGLVNIGTVEISGGTFSGNTAATNGGGIWNGNSGNVHGVLTISGGTISDNTATGQGGGIWNENEVTISRGSINSNTAGTNGGGVFSYSNINLSGNPAINSNTVNGSANNLYLNGSDTKINVTGSLSGANIKVTLQTRNRVITSGYNTHNSGTDPATIFFPDYSGHRFFMEGNEVRHTTTSATATTVATEEQLNTAISEGSTEIQLLADITLSRYCEISDGKTVTLDLNGYTLSRNLSEVTECGNILRVTSNGTLTIKDSSGDNSGKITGGNDSDGGGGICNYGTLTLDGGTITGCKAVYGGAVYVISGSFTMNGGVITDCSATDCGGIYNTSGGTLYVKGGTIQNCTSNGDGGGIVNYGTATISGGTITGNHAKSRGGGVWNGSSATLTINGGTITSNRADTNGGGVYTSKTINMSGKPYIKGNESSNLYLDGSSKIQVTGSLSGAKVGVSQSNYDSDIFTKDYSEYNNSNANTVFSADVSGYYVSYGGADAIINVNGYTYIECSWSGGNTDGHVVKTKKSRGYPYVVYGGGSSNDTSLSGGWYLLYSTFTFNKRVTINGDVKFILANGCNVEFDKGIYIPKDNKLTIYAEGDGNNMGYLWTDGSDGENGSIGGNKDNCGGHLVIHGGKIYAKPGSNNSAGIGGGDGSSSGMQSITIYGGNIEAYGKDSGAGIGSGQENSTVPSVTIYGGSITAKGGNYAAGIGGGEECSNGTIKIYGGTVTATGGGKSGSGGGAAGIGSGEESSQNNPIYIYGGTVNATGGQCGAGIGGAYKGNGGSVYVYGGNVTATGGQYGAGIGGGYRYTSTSAGRGGTLTVTGGTVNATGGEYSSGIGGGYKAQGGTVTISNGNVTATGGTWGAGIGGGWAADGGNVTISGGSVTVAAGTGADAIGRGADRNSGSDGSLTLGNIISVKQSGGSWVGSGSRVSTVRANGTYILQNCTHSGATYADKEDGTYHTISCSYCLGDDEAHTYGSDGKCTKCSYTSPEGAKTVTIYEANADGSGYDNGQWSMVNGQSYTLPSCTNVPAKMEFLGWMPGAPANGETVTWNVDEPLKAAGETIAVTDDIAFKARFRKIWNGSGTEGDPYQIDNEEDWNMLATNVSNGQSYSGTHFQLTNDISVSTMVGSSSTLFSGTFDGNGYTLTVSYTTTEQYTAPFRYVDGATIQNLKVAGTITPSAKFAAGIVGRATSTNTITNCVVDVTIDSQVNGDGTHGGIVANISNGTTTISGCVFKGTMTGSSTTNCGGFVGWTESNNSATVSITNSLFIPTTVEGTNGATNGATFARYRNSNSVTITDCYYTSALGEAQGTQGYTVTSGTEGLTLDFGDATTTYEYDGIKAYSFGLLYQDVLYSGSGQSVTFTPESDKEISNVAAISGTLTGPSNGIYTLTMPAENVSITATLGNFAVTFYDGQNNSTTIAANDDHIANVTLYDRTLYKDNSWNTICLPFDLTIAGSPLAGAMLKELDVEGKYDVDGNADVNGSYRTGFDGETLYLYFKDADEIEAGKPYIIKWANDVTNIVSPIEFGNVEIEGADPETVKSADGKVSFIGNYDPEDIEGSSYLYLGKSDKLYWPSTSKPINAFRAYFQLNGITAGTPQSGQGGGSEVRAFVLNFGDDGETTGIISTTNLTNYTNSAGAGWFDLQGCKLSGKPTKKGVYIHNGNKRVIK
jgi:hypothetical protein